MTQVRSAGARRDPDPDDASAVDSGWSSLREIVGIIWRDADAFVKRRLALVLVLVITGSVLSALGPVALKRLVDDLTEETAARPVALGLLVAFYVLSQCLSRLIGEIRGLVHARAERRMFRRLSERLFGHVLRLPLGFHLDRHTGAINQTLENGLQGYQMILHHLVFTALPVTVELGTIILVLARLGHPLFVGLFVAALIAFSVAFARGAQAIGRAARNASVARIDAAARMTDALLNAEAIKAAAAEARIEAEVACKLLETETQEVAFYRRSASNGTTVTLIFGALLALIIGCAVYEVKVRELTVGAFVLLTSYTLQLLLPIESLGYALQAFSQGTAMLGRMLELFHTPAEAIGPQDPLPLARVGSGRLEFEAVTFSHRPPQNTLEAVSFAVAAGTSVGIVGTSGSGKSTLWRLLLRFWEPDDGRILLDGVPIHQLPLSTLRQCIAVVPQDAMLVHDTVAENIAFGATCTLAEIERAARLAHVHERIARLPQSYGTSIGELGGKLSGGERQRLLIARALIRSPAMYVFDEFTSMLDTATEQALLRTIREVCARATILIISHRLSAVVDTDQIIALDGGRLMEQGTHSELLQRGGYYAALWTAQQAGESLRRRAVNMADLVDRP